MPLMNSTQEIYTVFPDMNFTNSTNETSTTLDLYSFLVSGILTMALVIVGVGGNVAMVVSLVCNTKNWLPLYYYFLTFSIWNTILLASTVFFYVLPALVDTSWMIPELSIGGYYIGNAAMTAVIWLVLLVTIERCYAVSRPFSQMLSKPKLRAKIVTVAISIFAPLYCLPLLFELTPTMDTKTNTLVLEQSNLRKATAYKIVYRIIGNLLFLSVVPFLTIIVMSVRIMYVVRNAMASSSNTHKNLSKQQATHSSLNLKPNPNPIPNSGLDSGLNPYPYPNLNSKPDSSPNSTSGPTTNAGRSPSRHRLPARQQLCKNGYTNEKLIAANSAVKKSSNPSQQWTPDGSEAPMSRCHSASGQKNSNATHVTLTVLATKFVLCYTLPTVLNILEIAIEPKGLQEAGLDTIVDLSNFMVVIDSALNTFVYISWRRKLLLQQRRSMHKRQMSVISRKRSSGIPKRGESFTQATDLVTNGQISNGRTVAYL